MKRVAIALASVLFGASCAATTPSSAEPAPSPATSSGPIVVIVFENHTYGQIIGNPCCPYFTAQAAQGRVYSNYNAITHPSLPNYLAVSGGSTCGKDSTDNVKPYCTGQNLWDQLQTAGVDWRVYQESMPKPCSLHNSSTYVVRHNPEAIYADQKKTVTCTGRDVALPTSFSSLPPFTFVTPNLCNDMHDCTPATGDNWLSTWLPKFLAVSGTRVIVTFDEGRKSDNHVATFEVGAGVPNTTDGASYDHYSLLAGIEDALGLSRLGDASTATPLPI